MKVLLINNCHWPRGGSESVYFNTANLLLEYGHEVIFFSMEDSQNIQTGEKEYFVHRGGKFEQIKSYFNNETSARLLESLILNEKPDIAHAHLFWGGLSASIIRVLHKYKIPLVHTAHDYRMVCPAYLLKDGKGFFCERCKGGRFYECAIHRCSKGSIVESFLMTAEMYYRNLKWHPAKVIDGIIFVSNFSRQKHLEFDNRFGDAKSIVLYNCPNKILYESNNTSIDTYNSYYLYYGRLSAEKGVPTLIKAFERSPQINLKIVGTGPLEEELKKYVAKHSLNNIEFVGYKSGKELFDTVANAKYVCVSSECYENNPMTIVEAYSLRTPVIGAAIGGITEIINEGQTGFAFESGNIDSLVDALAKADSISKEQYEVQKKNSFVFSQTNFSRERHIESLLTFYEELLKENNLK